MTDIKSAVQKAKDFSEMVGANNAKHPARVEEVEKTKNESDVEVWRITLGWPEESYKETGSNKGILASIGVDNNNPTFEALPRYYRTFDIDIKTGEVISMSMRY